MAGVAVKNTHLLRDLGEIMFPIPIHMEAPTGRSLTLLAFEIVTSVFDILVSLQNFKVWNTGTMEFALQRVQAERGDIQTKMDELLRSGDDTGNRWLEHALIYVNNIERHPEAYKTFEDVLKTLSMNFFD